MRRVAVEQANRNSELIDSDPTTAGLRVDWCEKLDACARMQPRGQRYRPACRKTAGGMTHRVRRFADKDRHCLSYRWRSPCVFRHQPTRNSVTIANCYQFHAGTSRKIKCKRSGESARCRTSRRTHQPETIQDPNRGVLGRGTDSASSHRSRHEYGNLHAGGQGYLWLRQAE